jgi:signal peptidase I
LANSDTSEQTQKRSSRSSRSSGRRTAAGGRNGASDEQPKGQLRQWGEAFLFAAIVVLIVRTLFFDLFRIPTPSMEKNLLVGDYLFVSKLHYGTRLPLTLGVPLTSIYLPGVEFPLTRLPGFSDVERGDPIVFNYPPEELPVDRKAHYIKRVIGLPGETLSVRDKTVYVDGEPMPLGRGMQQYWLVHKQDARYQLSGARLRELGVSEVQPTRDATIVRMLTTRSAIEQINGWPWVDKVEPYIIPQSAVDYYDEMLYPKGSNYTPDNYGPLPIPKEGETVTLTTQNWPAYRAVIERFEGHTAEQTSDSTFVIDGQPATEYTFEQDYFFVMGDNRDNSQDSRFWGYVPMSHVVGKAIFTYFSWDSGENLPRFGRILKFIDDDEVFRSSPVLTNEAAPASSDPAPADQ